MLDNSAPSGGGASFQAGVLAPQSLIEFVTFRGNAATTGGGMHWSSAAGSVVNVVRNCRFEANQGGGLWMGHATAATFAQAWVQHCVFRGNTKAGAGSGAFLSLQGVASQSASVLNCVFDGDDLVSTKALFVGGSIFLNHPAPIAWTGSITVDHSITPVFYPGGWSFQADPLHVDPANGDYHLTAFSPAIDRGTAFDPTPGAVAPKGDFEGDAYVGEKTDTGADEFAPHVYLHGDPVAGAPVHLRVVGPAGARVTLFLSPALAAAPIATPFGAFGLGQPLVGGKGFPLGVLSTSGVADVPGVLPAGTPPFTTFHVQALIEGDDATTLTNVETIVVF